MGQKLTAKFSNATKTKWQRAHANADGTCKGDWADIAGTEKTWGFAATNNTIEYTITKDDCENKYMYYRVYAVGDA